MATATADGFLIFNALDTGTALIPSSNWNLDSTNLNVVDQTPEGTLNSSDYFNIPTATYSGYTVEINGNTYAIFNLNTGFFVPFFNAIEDLSGLDGTAVTQTITQTGNTGGAANLCFVDGTLIATPDGERVVEELQIGDEVLTADGRGVPVKWIGRQFISAPVNAAIDEKLAPVRISAGTLGTHTDLTVSADHGLIVDGFVITAGALVNGTTIRFVPAADLPQSFTYYHIETEAHDAILANGAKAETFIDYAGRQAFDNYDEYLSLYGADRLIHECPLPRISSTRLVPHGIKARLGSLAQTAA